MRFIDSNVFLHAFLIPRRKLTPEEQRIKDYSKSIVEAVEEGEEVAMTTAHLSEIVNIVETGLGLKQSLGFLAWAVTAKNLSILPTSSEDYEASLVVARDKNIGANDALAYVHMMKQGVGEIYTFDKHYDQLKDISSRREP